MNSTIEVWNTVTGRTARYMGAYDMWFPHGDVNKPYSRAWWTHTMLLHGFNHTVIMSFRPLDTELFLGAGGMVVSGGNDTQPYGDGVTDQASFNDRRNSVLTATDPLNNAHVDSSRFGWHGKPANSAMMHWAEGDGDCGKWSDWPDRTMWNYQSIDPEHRMTYTASLGNLDYLRSVPTQTWGDKWEAWEHLFANAYYLAKTWPDYFNGRVLFWNSTNSEGIDTSGVGLMRDAVEQAMIKAGKLAGDVSVTFGHDAYDWSFADSDPTPLYDRGVRHTYDMSPMGDLRTSSGNLSRPVYLAYNEFSSTHGTGGQGIVSRMTESEGNDLLKLTNRFNLAGDGLEEYDQYTPWHPMAEKNYTLSTPIDKAGNVIFGGGGTYSNYVWSDDYYDNPPTFLASPGMYYYIMGLRAAGRGGARKEIVATFGGEKYTTMATRDGRFLYVTMASDFPDTIDLQFDPTFGLTGKSYDVYQKDAGHNDVVVASGTVAGNRIDGVSLPSPGAMQVVIDHGGTAIATAGYDEDFSAFDSTMYRVVSGSPTVAVTAGALDLLGTGGILLKRASSSNVVVETEFTVQTDSNNLSALITFGHWNGKMNMVGMDGGQWVIYDKMDAGRAQTLLEFSMSRGTTYKLKVELSGQVCSLFVDGGSGYYLLLQSLLLANDDSALGLHVNDAHVRFSRFKVNYAGAAQTTGYALLSITPYEFDLATVGGSQSKTFTVQNVGAGTLSYSVSPMDPHVTVDLASGNSSGAKNTITLTVNAAGLAPGRYVERIRIDGGGNNYHVLPVKFQIAAGSPVQAATASSQLTGYPPSKAVDGDADTASRWAAADGSYPQWLKLDLGGIKSIDKVRTVFYQYSTRTYSYEIQTSVDDTSYSTVVASKNTSPAVDWNEDIFPATNGRFVRINIIGCSETGGYAQVTETQIYAT